MTTNPPFCREVTTAALAAFGRSRSVFAMLRRGPWMPIGGAGRGETIDGHSGPAMEQSDFEMVG